MKRGRVMFVKIGMVLLIVAIVCCMPVAGDIPPLLYSRMVADKVEYSAGDTITYHFEIASGGWLEHTAISNARFILDRHITDISDNMPDYCSVQGNQVICSNVTLQYHDNSPLWEFPRRFNDLLWVVTSDPSRHDVFTITGKIEGDTPIGTKISSYPVFDVVCSESSSWNRCPGWMRFEGSVVGVGFIYIPEFPSLLLPAASIIGLLGIIFLFRRSRK